MPLIRPVICALIVSLLQAGAAQASVLADRSHATDSSFANSSAALTGQTGAATPGTTKKVLIFVEENHSLLQMRHGMPYLNSLAKKYSIAVHYSAVSHPSLPNYLAIAGGSTFGIADDNYPKAHTLSGRTVFDQALHAGKTAKTYAESMPTHCALTNHAPYAVKHNPWAYFTNSRRRCNRYDVPLGTITKGALAHDIQHGVLPSVGLVVPNVNNDAHDGSLATANAWLALWLPQVLKSQAFTSGRLTVIVTADESDRSATNKVATVVMHAGMQHRRVTTALNHYSLTGYIDHVLGVRLLRHATRGFARAFGL